ncbi:MAG: hypothetical protein AB7I59_26250 [Geminicoccaceae bacterium]
MDAISATRTLPRPETGARPPPAPRSAEAALDRYRQACRAEEAARLFLTGLGRLHGPMA